MGLLDRALDQSVVFAFDRTGFERHRRRFVAADLEVDLRDRRIVITGANAGLGFAATRALHARGATVFLVCRDRGRGEEAQSRLREGPGRGEARLVIADVADLGSVRRASDQLPERLDVLVHNAGVLPDAWRRTEDGLESAWATNVVGPYLLTDRLSARLSRSEDARVITVTSGGLYGVGLDVEVALRAGDPTPEPRFDGVKQYAHTKRAELVLSDRWAAEVPGVGFHAMHPGWADTGGVKRSLPRFRALTKTILRTPEQGADTIVWLAAAPRDRLEPATGGFWFDRGLAPRHRLARTRRGDADADRLWSIVRAQARV